MAEAFTVLRWALHFFWYTPVKGDVVISYVKQPVLSFIYHPSTELFAHS